MTSGIVGFLLNAVSITMLAAVLVIVLLTIFLLTDIAELSQFSAPDRQLLLWIIVLTPWVVGVLTTVIVVVASQSEIAASFSGSFIHWHHLSEFNWNSWHGMLVLSMLVIAVLMVARVIRRLHGVNKSIDLLKEFSEERQDGILELESDSYAAFTAGVRKPNSYMTTALINQLDANEYAVIRIHEISHVESRDPARRAWFFVMAGLFPSVIARFLISQMVTATEQLADSRVVQEYSDRAFIARVLLKVHRLTKQSVNRFGSTVDVCHFGTDSIEQRIHYLLSERERKSISLVIIISLMLVLAAGCALTADSLHHALELPWQH